MEIAFATVAFFPKLFFPTRERESSLRVCILVCAYVRESSMNEFISATTMQCSTVLCSFFHILITHCTIVHIIQSKLYPPFWFRKTFSLTIHFFVPPFTLCKILWLWHWNTMLLVLYSPYYERVKFTRPQYIKHSLILTVRGNTKNLVIFSWLIHFWMHSCRCLIRTHTLPPFSTLQLTHINTYACMYAYRKFFANCRTHWPTVCASVGEGGLSEAGHSGRLSKSF